MELHRLRMRAPLLAAGALLWSAGCNSCSCSMSYEPGGGASRSASGPPPLPDGPRDGARVTRDEALQVYERYVEACRTKDAEALWKMLVRELRLASDERAKEFREVGAEELREVLGYGGPLEAFSGLELHRIGSFNEFGMCSRVRRWRVEQVRPDGYDQAIIVKHPKRWLMALVVTRNGEGVLRVRPTQWQTPSP